MTSCTRCGSQVNDGAKTCASCGVKYEDIQETQEEPKYMSAPVMKKRRIPIIVKISLFFAAFIIIALIISALFDDGSNQTSGDSSQNTDKKWSSLSYEDVNIEYPPEWEVDSTLGKMVYMPGKKVYISLTTAPGEGPRISQMNEDTVRFHYEASLTYENPTIEMFENKKIDGEEAVTAVLTAVEDEIGSDPVTYLIFHALLRRGDNAVTIICTCKEEDREEFEDIFGQVINSITIIK